MFQHLLFKSIQQVSTDPFPKGYVMSSGMGDDDRPAYEIAGSLVRYKCYKHKN